MSDEETPNRPRRDRAKIDYAKLHATGREELSDSDSECFKILPSLNLDLDQSKKIPGYLSVGYRHTTTVTNTCN